MTGLHDVTGACLCRDIEVPDEGPAVVSALIDECLQPNPAKRPTAAAICERIEVWPAPGISWRK